MFHEIVVTGALAYDTILNLPGKFSSYILPDNLHQINISFATDTHTKTFGGTGGNQAYSLGLLGMQPILVGTVGNDFGPYLDFLKKGERVDTSSIHHIENELTAMGIAITDESDNQIWGFSKGAMRFAKSLSIKPLIKRLHSSDKNVFVIIAPNEPKAISRYVNECVSLGIEFAFDPAFYIPVTDTKTLKKGLENARIVFGNDYEISLLQKRLNLSKPKELTGSDKKIIVTTFGKKGSEIQYKDPKSKSDKKIKIKSAQPATFVDPTGAGDAYRAGFLSGFLKEYDLKTCGQMGSVAASFAIEHRGTIKHSYTTKAFWKRYNENYKT